MAQTVLCYKFIIPGNGCRILILERVRFNFYGALSLALNRMNAISEVIQD